jgi:hypothetical protein
VRKTVTVVFADVAGSTGLGERPDPESVRRSVDEERGTVETVNWLLGPTDAGSRSAGAGAIDPSAAQPRDTNGASP